MRILVAPDKFKGSLTAREAAARIAAGLRDVLPDAVIETLPVADGGEGTADVISDAVGGEWTSCPARDPLGRPVDARYLLRRDSAEAVIEMSEAAGGWRVAQGEHDLLRANTFGVGEMMRNAVESGAKKIVIGLGGSATNDGGFGMARALGFRFLAGDKELSNGTDELLNLTQILPVELPLIQLTAAADVKNPLLGSRGATQTFGPQKGGTPEELDVLERSLARLADVVRRDLGCDFRDVPGAGAAGGLGFGLMSFCGATLRPGFDLVAEILGLEAAIERADVVITGEGCLDRQTLEGKAPAGVAHLSRQMKKRVFAIVGCTTGEETVSEIFEGIFLLATPPITRAEAMARAGELLEERGRQLAREL